MKTIEQIAAELQGYDPGALRADAVNEFPARLVEPLEDTETVGVFQALDRVLAADLISPISVPPHDNSAMDGFAFAGAQLQPGQALALRVVGTAYAGAAWQGPVGAGECLRIMTGAVMPAGLDTVVPVEFTRIEGDIVTLPAGCVQAGDNRRLLGEDLLAGAPALRAGTAWSGSARPDREPGTGQRDRAAPPEGGLLLDRRRDPEPGRGAARGLGLRQQPLHAVRAAHAPGRRADRLRRRQDDPASLEAAFRRAAAEADVVITSGGQRRRGRSHQGHHEAARRRGVLAHRDAPGRLMAVGQLQQAGRSALLFGLPGNPVAVMVTFLAFVRPALLRLMGMADAAALYLPASSQEPIRKKPGRTEFQRGIASRAADGSLQVRTTGSQGSGVLRSMAEANCLLVLPHGQGRRRSAIASSCCCSTA